MEGLVLGREHRDHGRDRHRERGPWPIRSLARLPLWTRPIALSVRGARAIAAPAIDRVDARVAEDDSLSPRVRGVLDRRDHLALGVLFGSCRQDRHGPGRDGARRRRGYGLRIARCSSIAGHSSVTASLIYRRISARIRTGSPGEIVAQDDHRPQRARFVHHLLCAVGVAPTPTARKPTISANRIPIGGQHPG